MRLEEMKRIAEARTKGEWKIDHNKETYFTPSSIYSPKKRAWDEEDDEYNAICNFPRSCEYNFGSDPHIEPDAKFIAMAANNFDKLLKVVEAAKELNSFHLFESNDDEEWNCGCKGHRLFEAAMEELEGE